MLKQVGVIDYVFYFLRGRKNEGTFLIMLSEKITVESLSCDTIIKNNMNQQKLIEILDEGKIEQFYKLKPKMIRELTKFNPKFNLLKAILLYCK